MVRVLGGIVPIGQTVRLSNGFCTAKLGIASDERTNMCWLVQCISGKLGSRNVVKVTLIYDADAGGF